MRNSKAGKRFVGCSGYPKCTQTYSLPQNGYIKKLGETCKNCGLNVLSIKGRGKRPWKLCIKCGFVNFKKKEIGEGESNANAAPVAAAPEASKPKKAAAKARKGSRSARPARQPADGAPRAKKPKAPKKMVAL